MSDVENEEDVWMIRRQRKAWMIMEELVWSRIRGFQSMAEKKSGLWALSVLEQLALRQR